MHMHGVGHHDWILGKSVTSIFGKKWY